MLDLIVLGTVPGTNFQINFWLLVITVCLMLIIAKAWFVHRRHKQVKSNLDLIAL
jgi:hypothetical protein